MKRLTIGILAHVDSGKTTLSEGLLYTAGTIRKLGRVDHKSAFLDTDEIERERGITIFSKQAVLAFGDTEFTLLDTPGHVDFSAEMERTLPVLDYAVLVVSGADGVQSHTETLWRLLAHYDVPVFVFVNKMDLGVREKDDLLRELRERLGDGCLDFSVLSAAGADGALASAGADGALASAHGVDGTGALASAGADGADGALASARGAFYEEAAMQGQALLDEYLETGAIAPDSLRRAIAAREIFPCFFGSALKMEGVREFLTALDEYTLPVDGGASASPGGHGAGSRATLADAGEDSRRGGTSPGGDRCGAFGASASGFGARVFKIADDERGQRMAYLKITHGSLRVKDYLEPKGAVGAASGSGVGAAAGQKVNELRVYSGAKYQSVPEVFAGSVCAVPGLSGAFPGQGFGVEPDAAELVSEPVFTYAVRLPEGTDSLSALAIFRKLAEEETKMGVVWNERFKTISVQLMGEVQLEVLKRILADRFGLAAEFEEGRILYQETIAAPVEGVGHYEPLRHYAEVHLLLEPGERGSGVVLATAVSEDALDRNWQRLVLTHLAEKTHIGVLTGSPLTDVKITLVAGRASLKHTEGGDFRQATYRAVRQGLMRAESVLLEPWYEFTLEVPTEATGRAMTDLQQMGAAFGAPETRGSFSVLQGRAPVAAVRGYHKAVASYTHGQGRLACVYSGYEPCADAADVIREIAYDCEADLDNPADSVFCEHGAGHIVKWNEVFDKMHLPALGARAETEEEDLRLAALRQAERAERRELSANDEELQHIFERTYGKVQGTRLHRPAMRREMPQVRYKGKEKAAGSAPDFLLIDGYNIIFAWEDLKKAAAESLDLARTRLIDRVGNFRAFRQNNIIIVFDAYRVDGAVRKTEKIHGVTIIYTKEAETADQFIEKATKELSKNYRVRVATSDYLEQIIILGHGATRVSAPELLSEIQLAESEMRQYLKR